MNHYGHLKLILTPKLPIIDSSNKERYDLRSESVDSYGNENGTKKIVKWNLW